MRKGQRCCRDRQKNGGGSCLIDLFALLSGVDENQKARHSDAQRSWKQLEKEATKVQQTLEQRIEALEAEVEGLLAAGTKATAALRSREAQAWCWIFL